MLQEVAARLEWYQVVCKWCHTFLSQLVDSMAIQTITNVITISPNALQRIHTACRIFMASHLSNKLKPLFIMADLHNKATLALVHINHTMVAMYRNRVTLDFPHSQCKEWSLVSH